MQSSMASLIIQEISSTANFESSLVDSDDAVMGGCGDVACVVSIMLQMCEQYLKCDELYSGISK